MLHHMALVPVELVHFVAELSHTLQVLYFRRPVFKEGCLVVFLVNVVRDVSLLLPLGVEHALEACDVKRCAEDVRLPLPEPLGAALPHLSISAGLGADVLAPVKALEAPEGGVHAAALARQRVYKAAVVVQRVLLRPDIVL